jgi:hypothetical protein
MKIGLGLSPAILRQGERGSPFFKPPALPEVMIFLPVATNEETWYDGSPRQGGDSNSTGKEKEPMKDREAMINQAAEKAYTLLNTGQRRA